MHAELHRFLARLSGTVVLTLVPVIFTAFVSMPMALSRHPGEPVPAGQLARHMS
jgi:hypothetical protein